MSWRPLAVVSCVLLLPALASAQDQLRYSKSYTVVGDYVAAGVDLRSNQAVNGMVKGTISWISEGAFMVDERTSQPTQEPYYKARISLTDTSLRNVPNGFRLIPGMTLTADVHIGTRSILSYLISGAVRHFSEAMREP